MNRTATVILLVLIAGAAAAIFSTLNKRRPTLPGYAKADVGRILAEETGKLLSKGGAVVIIARDPAEVPAVQGTLSSFQQTIKLFPGVNVAATRTLKFSEMTSMCRMPAAVYHDVLRQYPHAAALVSFIGAPELNDADISQPESKVPKLLVISPCAADFRPLFDAGVLHVVIMPRRKLPAPDAPKPTTARGWFDLSYEILTAPTAGSSVK